MPPYTDKALHRLQSLCFHTMAAIARLNEFANEDAYDDADEELATIHLNLSQIEDLLSSTEGRQTDERPF